LYSFPLTVAISGPLGAGKTTLLQGFFQALEIAEHVTSPTYALEQRYSIPHAPFEVLHLDLYRLTEEDARALVASTDDHKGIRAIEWPERAGREWLEKRCEKVIWIQLEETNVAKVAKETKGTYPLPPSETLATLGTSPHTQHSRTFHSTFADIPLPSRSDIESWRVEVMLPEHIARHCDAVGELSQHCADVCREQGFVVRPLALMRAAEVHDLLRFVDFHAGAAPDGGDGNYTSEEERLCWESFKKLYEGMRHEAACERFLAEQGFEALATIVATHGFFLGKRERRTIEQKLLFYADKRLAIDRVVTLEERFEDFRRRYAGGKVTAESTQWYEEVKAVEGELFPAGAP
jgi:tRNA threonylcarbamoyl adenosine modification protein YjeE